MRAQASACAQEGRRRRGWAYQDALPRPYTDFIALEADATDIRTFRPT
ncbi:hypothetical protein [Streptomyces sp. URMC 129]